ncbi:MAG: hypothetical protein B5766_04380 [Candidatus Lumbricidophila eiseniae]|uniref:Carbohydrate kinase FGGY N-terminal domain-containing protein n=1 Tax=Candidatus Lumbricidiphila eiseniae TaxID=1969409 RepID=A0A2A6FSP2_9MICO|nr:MAG: hypothetical protein B5766_04380 [Candidatus Lumbricidophila eiseniae]
MMGHHFAGLDLGTTSIKLLITDDDGAEILLLHRATPWRSRPHGMVEMVADELLSVVRSLLEEAAARLHTREQETSWVNALAVTGMGESGVLIDVTGQVTAPIFAWFDPRGEAEIAELPPDVAGDFSGLTGLPLSAQASVAKVLYLRKHGLELAALRWLNLPEFIVFSLGASPASEYSLTSRTGFLRVDEDGPWMAMLDYLGVPETFLPPLVDAGTSLGTLSQDSAVPSPFRGALLSVAGHDHLVSAVSSGDIPPDRYHVSCGTAEVLLRVLSTPLTRQARERLGAELINCVRHVTPHTWVLVAGTKSGLVAGRALQLLGIRDRLARDALDTLVMARVVNDGPARTDTIEVTGARNDDGVLRISVYADQSDPADLFTAVLAHGNDELRRLIAAMDREILPATSSFVTGGWASMRSVQWARTQVLPRPHFSDRVQETAYGASLLAQKTFVADGSAPSWNSDSDSDSSVGPPPQHTIALRGEPDFVSVRAPTSAAASL